MNLKPCPFCGSEAEARYDPKDYYRWYMECQGCDAEGPKAKNATEATTRWNQRCVSGNAYDPLLEPFLLAQNAAIECQHEWVTIQNPSRIIGETAFTYTICKKCKQQPK